MDPIPDSPDDTRTLLASQHHVHVQFREDVWKYDRNSRSLISAARRIGLSMALVVVHSSFASDEPCHRSGVLGAPGALLPNTPSPTSLSLEPHSVEPTCAGSEQEHHG